MSKTIFITGSSTGLGRATALLFADRGWNVIATLRNPDKETELGTVARITLLPLDVTKPAQIDDAVRRALAQGPVDVVFNNAGYGLAGPFEAVTDEQLVAEIDTNLLGVLRTTKAFLPASASGARVRSSRRRRSAGSRRFRSTRSTTQPSGAWRAGARAWRLNCQSSAFG